MNFNQANFPKKIVQDIDAKIKVIHQCENLTLRAIINFLISTNHIEQPEGFQSLIHLVVKMRFNLEAANDLQSKLAKDYRFKTSLNLLYRASVDDLVNIYYLMGFIIVNSDKQPSLNNELDIMHRDFLTSAEQIIEAEIETEFYAAEQTGLATAISSTPANWRDNLTQANAHLYDATKKKWRSNKEIRISSNPRLAPLPEATTFISESAKIKFIKQRGFTRHV